MDLEALDLYITRNCHALAAFLAERPNGDGRALRSALIESTSPKSAAGRLDDILRGDVAEIARQVLADPEARSALITTVAGSSYLFSVLRRYPSVLEPLFLRGGHRLTKNLDIKEREIAERIERVCDVNGLNRVLRGYKDEDYLRVGCRDLSGAADVREVMREISDLAVACIRSALSFHRQLLESKHGRPPGVLSGMGFVVLGLGKLSGAELNFSSDVDLIFLRSPEEGRTDGPKPVSVQTFYEALGLGLTRSLAEVTDDGFVFRTDLRLRPEGEKGELVPSVSNALQYYLDWGRTWERAALMKAGAIAGDIQLGNVFLSGLNPFIFRKFLDYSTLEEMRLMKARIERQLKRKPTLNIKLGQGGIREIEFFVQTLQLINAGKTPGIRSKSTMESLALLNDAGLLDHDATEKLRSAYRFFRMVEHRIQINYQLQTHDIPKSLQEQEELARRMGYRGQGALDSFMADLDAHRSVVGDFFGGLFYAGSDEEEQPDNEDVRRILDAIHNDEALAAVCEDLGVFDPKESCRRIKDLVMPDERRLYSDKARHILERLAPIFLEEILRVPEPGNALIALDRYINALRPSPSYFSTLLENPAAARFLVKILGHSDFFADLLVHHPQTIDSIIGRSIALSSTDRRTLSAELTQRSAYCADYESGLDVLRIFKNEQLLRIGVRHLSGEMDSGSARSLITELAEVCLEAAVGIAAKEMAHRFGDPGPTEDLPFVIVGMGKLGGKEMSYLSDVDVIFVFDPKSENVGTLSAREWFTRLGNRVISVLSVPTSEGICFSMDTRLRPSGNQGPLVTSLASFREYHATTSKLWEKQALIRARPVTGPPDLRARIDEIIKECVLNTHITPPDLSEIARLRSRMEQEIAREDSLHVDLKTGHGGLVDVEFFVQGMTLLHGARHPEILCRNTLDSLLALRRVGLVDFDSFQTLDKGYRFLIDLEDRLRILEQRSVNRIRLEGPKLRGLARRLGYEEGNENALVHDYFSITRGIRGIYQSLFGTNAVFET
ncbi:MAG: bifunctional [glutamate--ammonia ligase]-adenylyl-L-tyrosine phosphorylase/[glutamate--ammonia-ligase] adenylyltransferase [Pseudomonadota bacterium]